MPILETLTLTVGPPIAKAILKVWLKDSELAQDIGGELIDLLKTKITDIRGQQQGKRQFEEIGEKVAEDLLPIFQKDELTPAKQEQIANAVAVTINKAKIDIKLLLQKGLEPYFLADHLLHNQANIVKSFSIDEFKIFEQAIKKASDYIIDISSQLPDFTEQSLVEILKNGNQLSEIANKILIEVRRIREDSKISNPQEEAASFEEEYRLAIDRKVNKMELFGIDVTYSASRKYPLNVAYVSLMVRKNEFYDKTKTMRLDADESDINENDDIAILPVEEVLSKTKNLLIRGDAGNGKTTLLKWIAVNSAMKTFDKHLEYLNSTIPFLIPLRNCVETALPAPEDFPRIIVPLIADKMPSKWVHEKLENGDAIVLIDGVDEVPQSHS